MKCPHCQVAFHWDPRAEYLLRDKSGHWDAMYSTCPACRRLIMKLAVYDEPPTDDRLPFPSEEFVVFPRRTNARPACPRAVPESIARRYTQACLILDDSPEAAAALARRCLQQVLREEGGVKSNTLADEIAQVLAAGKLPTAVADSIDAIRHYGNFAAHATKSVVTGEIIDVEPDEAEGTLIALEALFDVYYVMPAKIKASRAKLEAKLKEAGKK